MSVDERHPLFYFISFIGIYSPLTDIVNVHIVYINESNPYTPLVSISQIINQSKHILPPQACVHSSAHPSATSPN